MKRRGARGRFGSYHPPMGMPASGHRRPGESGASDSVSQKVRKGRRKRKKGPSGIASKEWIEPERTQEKRKYHSSHLTRKIKSCCTIKSAEVKEGKGKKAICSTKTSRPHTSSPEECSSGP